jgi:hypothetical protein
MPDGRGGCDAGTTEGRVGAAAPGGAALGLDGGGAVFKGGATGGLLAGRVGNWGGCLGGGSTAGCPFCMFAMMCLPRWTHRVTRSPSLVCNRGTAGSARTPVGALTVLAPGSAADDRSTGNRRFLAKREPRGETFDPHVKRPT